MGGGRKVEDEGERKGGERGIKSSFARSENFSMPTRVRECLSWARGKRQSCIAKMWCNRGYNTDANLSRQSAYNYTLLYLVLRLYYLNRVLRTYLFLRITVLEILIFSIEKLARSRAWDELFHCILYKVKILFCIAFDVIFGSIG